MAWQEPSYDMKNYWIIMRDKGCKSLANILRLSRCNPIAPCQRAWPCRRKPRSFQSWRCSVTNRDHSWRPCWGRGIPRGQQLSLLLHRHKAGCRHLIREQNPGKHNLSISKWVCQNFQTYLFVKFPDIFVSRCNVALDDGSGTHFLRRFEYTHYGLRGTG